MTEYPPPSDPGDASRPDPNGQPYRYPSGQPYQHQYPPPLYQPYGQPSNDVPQYNQPQDARSGAERYGQPPPTDWYPAMPGDPAAPRHGEPYGRLPANRRWDGWSVAGLILGVLPTVVLGAVLSIVGLVRTRTRQRRGRALAVAGLVLSLAWLAGLVVLGVQNAHRGSAADANVDPLTLNLGACFQQAPPTSRSATVRKLPCAKPHNAVIFAIVELADARYPGGPELSGQAIALCDRQVAGYLGRSPDRLQTDAFMPSAASWKLGRRQASCVLYDPSRDFTGDIRQDH